MTTITMVVPFDGICLGCLGDLPKGSQALFVPAKGMFHPACA